MNKQDRANQSGRIIVGSTFSCYYHYFMNTAAGLREAEQLRDYLNNEYEGVCGNDKINVEIFIPKVI